MTKTISWFVLAAVVIFVGYLLIGGSNESLKETAEVNTPTETETLTPVTLTLGTLAIDPERSVIQWEGRKTFIKEYLDHGTIRVKNGSVLVKDGVAKDGIFTLDTTSIAAESTGRGEGETLLTKHLKSPDFFNAEMYPEAIFSFKKITPGATSMAYDVVGDLTIKNKTNEITFQATIGEDSAGLVKLKATLELDRTLWDIRYGSGKFFENLGDALIDDLFGLKLNLVFKKE